MSPSDPTPSTSRSLRPNTPVTMSVTQILALAMTIGGASFALGAVYPRISSIETTLTKLQSAQDKTVKTLAKLSVIVGRIDREQGKRRASFSSDGPVDAEEAPGE
jgi:hypothetical protein